MLLFFWLIEVIEYGSDLFLLEIRVGGHLIAGSSAFRRPELQAEIDRAEAFSGYVQIGANVPPPVLNNMTGSASLRGYEVSAPVQYRVGSLGFCYKEHDE